MSFSVVFILVRVKKERSRLISSVRVLILSMKFEYSVLGRKVSFKYVIYDVKVIVRYLDFYEYDIEEF